MNRERWLLIASTGSAVIFSSVSKDIKTLDRIYVRGQLVLQTSYR